MKSKQLSEKLQSLPKTPGVYFHKNSKGKIIYVGKAAILRNRVRQYFQDSTKRTADPKTIALISEIFDTDWVEVDSEMEALFLEAELIKRYKPRYNILERDDKAASYVRIDRKSVAPSVTTTRRPLDDGAEYFGPYLNTWALRKALKYLRKVFPYSIHTTLPTRACLHYHLGLCPGPETNNYDQRAYKQNLAHLVAYLKGQRVAIINDLQREMKALAKDQKYEAAAKVRNQLKDLRSLSSQIIFSDKENLDLSKDHALVDLADLLGLPKPPRRIEGFDISHQQGTHNVASMVVFTNGVSDKSAYRKFKMRLPGNDDFGHMREVILRRVSDKNVKAWGVPDLLLIDGGKGQLAAALQALGEAGVNIPAVGLAKQDEQIVVKNQSSDTNLNLDIVKQLNATLEQSEDFSLINLPKSAHLIKLLQRVRDESHRFAVSYHSTLKLGAQKRSLLDEIPTIGPATRKKLLRTFGSIKGIQQARKDELVNVIGASKAKIIRQYLRK
ncbi:excinuclease ABC subunit UvrC [Candidatus Saccharibacteria bacterium]|nr:excinuclease ABC subunit UvrC [Candidatus Saccharibacteria bacterium]